MHRSFEHFWNLISVSYLPCLRYTCLTAVSTYVLVGSPLWIIKPSTNFIDLARCPWSFPETTTLQVTFCSTFHYVPQHYVPYSVYGVYNRLFSQLNYQAIPWIPVDNLCVQAIWENSLSLFIYTTCTCK